MMAKRKTKKPRKCRDVCLTERQAHLLTGLQSAAQSLIVPAYWTPEEALAVFELIDDLRDRIWSIYQINLRDLIQQQCQPAPPGNPIQSDDDDMPF
jgi:hypothetical protein